MSKSSQPPLRFTIHVVDQQRHISMPIATSKNEAKMRKHFKEITKTMPNKHFRLYDGENLMDEHQPH